MKLLHRHYTEDRCAHPCWRHAMLFALAVAVLAFAWLSFNALIRFVILD